MITKEISNVTLATRLYALQQQRELIETQEKAVKDLLLASLKEQGVGFVRLDDGTTFTRSHRESLKVVDEVKAEKWAEDNNCWKLDTTKAFKILRRDLKPLPKFFKRVVGQDYLTVKRKGDKDEE